MVDIDGLFDTMVYIDATEQGKMVLITVFCSFEVTLEKAYFLLKKIEKRRKKIMKNAMDKNVFEMIAEYFINERLGDILMQDERYVKLQDEIWERRERMEMSSMDRDQCIAVEELILLHIKCIDYYAKKAYEYGVKDCIAVLRKLDLIKI